MEYTRVNIAITPSKEVQENAYRLSRDIASLTDAYFILDGKNFFPHATIYSTEYPTKNVDAVLDSVADIVSKTLPFSITCETVNTHIGYMDFQLLKTNELSTLHENIIAAVNPLRENHLRKKYQDPQELAKYSLEQQGYIQNYGYLEVFNAFRPHITLSRVKDENAASEIIKNLQYDPFTFTLQTITAYTMGDHGTCTGIIKEFTVIS